MRTKQVTSFQRRVYDLISTIPAGKVSTYGRVAKALQCGSAQAIGQALRNNPYAPEVPCHRVISADLGLGGFSGQTEGEELVRKKKLLESEGVTFTTEGLVSTDCLYEF